MKDFLKNTGLILFIDAFIYWFIESLWFTLEININDCLTSIVTFTFSVIISLATQLIFRFKKRYILTERFILSLIEFIFSSHYKGVNIMSGVIIMFTAVIRCITAIFLNKAGDKLFCKLSLKKSALLMTSVFMICIMTFSGIGAYRQSVFYTQTKGTVTQYCYDGSYVYFVDYEDSDGVIHNKVRMDCPSGYDDTKSEILNEGDKVDIVYPNKNDSKYEYVNLYINYPLIILSASALTILCIFLLIKENKSKTESA